MFPAGLSMLWEDTDPTAALADRFGFASLQSAAAWVGSTLSQRWGRAGARCERIVLSDHNAIAWVHLDDHMLIVKIASRMSEFARLDAVAGLLTQLAAAGVATPTPVTASDGSARVVIDHDGHPLSVLVQPRIEGDLLDVDDLRAVRATGEALGRLHRVLAELPPGPLHVAGRGASAPMRDRFVGLLSRSTAVAAQHRLAALLDTLPDLDAEPQLTHGDIRSANVLVQDHEVAALLDFDEVGLDHRVAELGRSAVLLATQFRQWGPTPPDAQQALIEGYRCAVDLSDAELGWLEAAILASSLAMIPSGPDPTGWAAAADCAAAQD